MRFKMIYVIVILMLLGICGVGMTAQTTDFSGYNLMVLTDPTQYTIDGLAGNPVLIYNAGTQRIELNDAFAGGGNLDDGTAQGQLLFWNNAGGIWTHDEITEAWWDDTNKSLGIGADSAGTTPYSYLVVRDDTLDIATGYSGAFIKINKTAGATNATHTITGLSATTTFNQIGGAIGNLYGISSATLLTDGTVDAAIGGVTGWGSTVSLTGGAVSDDVIGASVSISQGVGNTIAGDAYGIKSNNTSTGVTGTVWGIQNNIESAGGGTAIFGQQSNITKTSDNLAGNFYGTQTNLTNTAGNVGGYMVNGDFITTLTAGTITGNLYGVSINNDMNGGTLANAYGIYNQNDAAAGVTSITGSLYGAYHLVDSDEPLGGSMYGQVTDVNHVLGAITGNLVGQSIDLDDTGGSAVNSIGFLNVGTYDDSTITDDILGISNAVNVLAGDFALTDDLYGMSNVVNIADDCGDDVMGISSVIAQTAGTIAGDAYGIKVDSDYDGTVTGTTYGVYIDDTQTGLDIALYQEGTTVKPWATLDLAVTDGANRDLVLPNGTNFLCSNATGAFAINSLTGGVAGRMITIYNSAAQNMTITNEDGGSAAANRITTTTGGDMATVAAGCVSFIYDGVTSRWLLIDMEV